MKNIFFISLIFFILTSCGKNKEVKIIAKNVATGVPYSGLQYMVVSSRTAANGEKYRTEASGTLNGNGEAMVSIKQKTGRSYSIRVIEPENTCYNKQITQFFDSPYDVNGTFTFEFAECAYLKLNINNINCQGAGDIMNFRSKQAYTEFQSWTNDRLGCYSYTSPDFFEVPAGWRIYEWKVNRGGGITSFKDSIFLDVNSNSIFNMNY